MNAALLDPQVSIVTTLNFVNVNLDLMAPNVTIAFQNQRDHYANKDSEIQEGFAFQKDQKVESDTVKISIFKLKGPQRKEIYCSCLFT